MIKRKSKHEFAVVIKSPYTIDNLREARNWCSEIFGPGGRNKKYKWRYGWVEHNHNTFYFRTEKDALFFTLRWS